MRKSILFGSMLFLFAATFLSSCKEKDETADKLVSFNITSPIAAEGIIDNDAKTVEFAVPYGTDLKSVKGTATAEGGVAITPDLMTGVDLSGLQVTFTVGKTAFTVIVTVGDNPLRVALVGKEAYNSLDKEVKAAYDWALATYPSGKAKYFTWDEIASADLASTKVVWIHHTMFPNTGVVDSADARNAAKIWPASAISAVTIKKISDYAKAGGNLLLTSLATNYVVEYGRIDRKYGPTQFDVGKDEYIVNPDNWGISYQEGHFEAGQYPADNKDFYLFKGLTTSNVTFEGKTYPAIFLSDKGNKKNRANIWVFPRLFDPKDKWFTGTAKSDTLLNTPKKMFEAATTSTVRASFEWDPAAGGIELGAIVEFKPTATFKGTTIIIGPGAYEWFIVPSADDNTNVWDINVKGITKNALDKLGGLN